MHREAVEICLSTHPLAWKECPQQILRPNLWQNRKIPQQQPRRNAKGTNKFLVRLTRFARCLAQVTPSAKLEAPVKVVPARAFSSRPCDLDAFFRSRAYRLWARLCLQSLGRFRKFLRNSRYVSVRIALREPHCK